MSILDKIKPVYVEVLGLLLAGGGALLLHHWFYTWPALGLLLLYVLDRVDPVAFKYVQTFAKPATWPGYVALGIAMLIAVAAHGFGGLVLAAGLLTTGVGRFFSSLY